MNHDNNNLLLIPQSELETTFKQLITDKASFFAFLYGEHDADGKSWCPDCVTAEPVIEEAISFLGTESSKKSQLIKFVKLPVVKAERSVYTNHPQIKLGKIPSLIFYESGVAFGRLIEGELFDKDNVIQFIKQALE